jgi:catechol 2,3-dioxygenase-like lactoylglutathione lyase family enzyme
MLERVDRVLLAVKDAQEAATTLTAVLGGEKVREDQIGIYNAGRVVVQCGRAEFELLAPAGEGAVASHLAQWGEGLFAAGFAARDIGAISRHIDDAGLHFRDEAGQVFIEPGQTRGMRTVITPEMEMGAPGLITHLYEVTNIVEDHKQAASYYAHAFGLDAARFCPIESERWGYVGTLTMFDPPARLDRIELTQTTDPTKAMGRFFARRGESIYMCFAESDEPQAIIRNLSERDARFTGDPDFGDSLFIHPSGFHGMLMGISATNLAWKWSGRPELAPQG